MIPTVSSADFGKEVLESSHPVLVDFFAAWCVPCRMLTTELEVLRRAYGGRLKICRVSVEEAPDLAETYRVQAVPTVIFFKSGVPAERFTGFHTADEIDEMLWRL